MIYTVDDLHEYVASKNVEAIKYLMAEGLVAIEDGKLKATDKSKERAKFNVGFWHQRQLARKILLNSLN